MDEDDSKMYGLNDYSTPKRKFLVSRNGFTFDSQNSCLKVLSDTE